MGDLRYLKQRGRTWYFQRAVPRDLRRLWLGPNPVVEALHTTDLVAAQAARWAVNARYEAQFAELRGRPLPMGVAEIEERARAKFHSTLEALHEYGLDDAALHEAASRVQTKLDLADPSKVHPEFGHGRPERVTNLDYARWRAELAAIEARRKALQGVASEAPATFGRGAIDPVTLKPVAAVRRSVSGPLFSAVAARFIAERQRDPKQKLMEQTRGQYEVAYRLFDDFAGQPKLTDVDRALASKFLDEIATLNPDWGRSPNTKGRSYREVMKLFGGHARGLSNKTINRFAMAISLVWKFAEDRDGFTGANPWTRQGRRIVGQRGRPQSDKRPYLPEEITALLRRPPIIAPNQYDMEAALPWLALISAFSGMRLNEVCSLDVADVKELGGILYFDIPQSKSEAGIRTTPVHSRILAAGLLEYLKRLPKGGRVFPGLKPGGPDRKLSWYASKAFTVYRRGLGLIDIDSTTSEDRIDFHSLRRSAATALKDAGIPDHLAHEVMGHENKDITYGLYAGRHKLPALQATVEAIRYDGA